VRDKAAGEPLTPGTERLKYVLPKEGRSVAEESGQTRTAREQIYAQIVERASRDPEFRKQLIQDPKGVVGQVFDVQIPESITVEVLEESPSKFYLVLPQASQEARQELTDQDLAAAAGRWETTGPPTHPYTSAHTAMCGPSCNPICSG
jgi:hypothetical protein